MSSPEWKPKLSASSFKSKADYALYVEGYNDAIRNTAAHDLYEVLEWVENTGMMEHGGGGDMIRAALAKARGE